MISVAKQSTAIQLAVNMVAILLRGNTTVKLDGSSRYIIAPIHQLLYFAIIKFWRHDCRNTLSTLELSRPCAGLWISPVVTGTCPPPCSAFSFTPLDGNRAVMYGGTIDSSSEPTSNVYIASLSKETVVSLKTTKMCLDVIKFGAAYL